MADRRIDVSSSGFWRELAEKARVIFCRIEDAASLNASEAASCLISVLGAETKTVGYTLGIEIVENAILVIRISDNLTIQSNVREINRLVNALRFNDNLKIVVEYAEITEIMLWSSAIVGVQRQGALLETIYVLNSNDNEEKNRDLEGFTLFSGYSILLNPDFISFGKRIPLSLRVPAPADPEGADGIPVVPAAGGAAAGGVLTSAVSGSIPGSPPVGLAAGAMASVPISVPQPLPPMGGRAAGGLLPSTGGSEVPRVSPATKLKDRQNFGVSATDPTITGGATPPPFGQHTSSHGSLPFTDPGDPGLRDPGLRIAEVHYPSIPQREALGPSIVGDSNRVVLSEVFTQAPPSSSAYSGTRVQRERPVKFEQEQRGDLSEIFSQVPSRPQTMEQGGIMSGIRRLFGIATSPDAPLSATPAPPITTASRAPAPSITAPITAAPVPAPPIAAAPIATSRVPAPPITATPVSTQTRAIQVSGEPGSQRVAAPIPPQQLRLGMGTEMQSDRRVRFSDQVTHIEDLRQKRLAEQPALYSRVSGVDRISDSERRRAGLPLGRHDETALPHEIPELRLWPGDRNVPHPSIIFGSNPKIAEVVEIAKTQHDINVAAAEAGLGELAQRIKSLGGTELISTTSLLPGQRHLVIAEKPETVGMVSRLLSLAGVPNVAVFATDSIDIRQHLIRNVFNGEAGDKTPIPLHVLAAREAKKEEQFRAIEARRAMKAFKCAVEKDMRSGKFPEYRSDDPDEVQYDSEISLQLVATVEGEDGPKTVSATYIKSETASASYSTKTPVVLVTNAPLESGGRPTFISHLHLLEGNSVSRELLEMLYTSDHPSHTPSLTAVSHIDVLPPIFGTATDQDEARFDKDAVDEEIYTGCDGADDTADPADVTCDGSQEEVRRSNIVYTGYVTVRSKYDNRTKIVSERRDLKYTRKGLVETRIEVSPPVIRTTRRSEQVATRKYEIITCDLGSNVDLTARGPSVIDENDDTVSYMRKDGGVLFRRTPAAAFPVTYQRDIDRALEAAKIMRKRVERTDIPISEFEHQTIDKTVKYISSVVKQPQPKKAG